jgi:tetratricopeptide (TPR) repeat protein
LPTDIKCTPPVTVFGIFWKAYPNILLRSNPLNPQQHVAYYRHAQFYLGLLPIAESLYQEGRERIDRALRLFDEEEANIFSAKAWAIQQIRGQKEVAELYKGTVLACAQVLDLRLHPQEYVSWLDQALIATQLIGDKQGEAVALNSLGMAYIALSNIQKALPLFEQVLELAREAGEFRTGP